MNDERDEKLEERMERWGRDFGRKAEEWGRHVERHAEDWGRRVEEKAERFAEKFEHKSQRRAMREERRAERRAERCERKAERREGRHMGRRDSFDGGRRTTLYRSRSGMICGVCKGIADYYGFNVFWTRVAAVVFASMTTFWPAVFLYAVAAMVMKPEPVLPLETEEDEEFYQSYSGSRTMALHRLKRTYDNLNRRIQRLENTVTARDFDWDERLNR